MRCFNCGDILQQVWLSLSHRCPSCGLIIDDADLMPMQSEIRFIQTQRKFETIINTEFADMPTRWGYKGDSNA